MTLRQTIQAAPTKTNDLIDKLSNTSNEAIKTRETLFQELSQQLTLYVDLEEQHLIPLLRKDASTRAIATDTLKGNKALRTLLTELEKAPKDDDAFTDKLAELKTGFQQHVRDERKELLPAVLKVLDDDEASQLAARIEGGIADAENKKRKAKREVARRAKRDAEAIKHQAGARRAAVRAQKAAAGQAARGVKKATDTAEREAGRVQAVVRQASEDLSQRTRRAVSSASDAIATYQGSVRMNVEDLRAVTEASTASARALSDVGAAVTDWASKSARTNVEVSREFLQCKTVAQVAETQMKFVSSMMRNWMEGSTQVLAIAQRASRQALRPLENRLDR
jgi:hypothetical protein